MNDHRDIPQTFVGWIINSIVVISGCLIAWRHITKPTLKKFERVLNADSAFSSAQEIVNSAQQFAEQQRAILRAQKTLSNINHLVAIADAIEYLGQTFVKRVEMESDVYYWMYDTTCPKEVTLDVAMAQMCSINGFEIAQLKCKATRKQIGVANCLGH
jgi:purine-nucleoside phosphorylase